MPACRTSKANQLVANKCLIGSGSAAPLTLALAKTQTQRRGEFFVP